MPKESNSSSQLDFLTAVERGEVVTQMSLSKRIGVAVGLINALLKRSMTKGYVKARQAPYKRYAYYLTPRGFAEKSRLVATYLESSLGFFRKARSQYAEIFQSAKRLGQARVVVVGDGELVEIAVLAAFAEDVKLSAIVDPEADGTERFGIAICRNLADLARVDLAIIADARRPQSTYEMLTQSLAESQIAAPPLLRITRDRDALIQAARKAERRA